MTVEDLLRELGRYAPETEVVVVSLEAEPVKTVAFIAPDPEGRVIIGIAPGGEERPTFAVHCPPEENKTVRAPDGIVVSPGTFRQ